MMMIHFKSVCKTQFSLFALLICGTIIVETDSVFAQVTSTGGKRDSVNVSTQKDTTRSVQITSAITCDADSSILIPDSMTILYGKPDKPAKVTFEDMTLTALKITWYTKGDSLVAEGESVPVSEAQRDSFPNGFKIIGRPVLTQKGQEPLTGLQMVYYRSTGKGKVYSGRTKFEGGYYFGENIVRLNENFLQIQSGTYTTCDKEQPHFFFKSTQMKMEVKKRVVARPVVLYFGSVPVFVVPFGVFPIHGGRSSGLIMPSYGESRIEGRYLRGFGYYYAPNDYIDATALADYYEKSGFFFRGDMRYVQRYSMSGAISGSITRKHFENLASRQWDLSIRHNQTIDPTMSLSASGYFVSDQSFNKLFKLNRDERTSRRLYSSANLIKQWENSKNSMTATVSRTQDLQTGSIEETLPSIAFNRNVPTDLFKRSPGSSGIPAGETALSRESISSGKEPFYSSLSIRYNSQLLSNHSKYRSGESGDFTRSVKSGIEHSIGLSMPTNLFKYFAVNPNVQYREEWYSEAVKKYVDTQNRVITEKENGFFARRTGNFSVELNTKMYGMFNTHIGSLQAVRHVMSPSLGFEYRPDFSDPVFGYYASYADTSGRRIRYDRFTNAMFGSTGAGKSASLRMSLQNLFQVKTKHGETENKFDFINITSSTSYNLAAPLSSRRLSDLYSSFRIMKYTNLTLNTTHSFYTFDPAARRWTNTYLFDTGKSLWKNRFLQLTNLTASTSFQLKSRQGGQKLEEAVDVFDEEQAVTLAGQSDLQERFEKRSTIENQEIPWDLNMSFQFGMNRFNPLNVQKLFTAQTDFNIKATEHWNIGYQAYFDLREKTIVSQDFRIYRDLHCWEMNLSWTPSNSSRSGYWLEIRVKEPKLRDLRIKKTDYGGSALLGRR